MGKKQLKIKRHVLGDVQLERFLNDPYRALPNGKADIAHVAPFQSEMNASVLSIESLRNTVLEFDVHRDKCMRCAWCVFSFLATASVLCAVAAIMLFPTVPTYYVCDTATDWNSIWSSMEHLSPQSTYNVLFTIKNNNYFSTELTNIRIRLYYEKENIGY